MNEPMNPDSGAVYDAEISPLMTKIIEICKAHKIPVVACFQIQDASHESGAGFCTTRISYTGESVTLARATWILTTMPDPVLAVKVASESKPTE